MTVWRYKFYLRVLMIKNKWFEPRSINRCLQNVIV